MGRPEDYTQTAFDRGNFEMTEAAERVCVGCGDTEEVALLERCAICTRYFCPDCVYRALGRRFCSDQCSRGYFYGDSDDDPDSGIDDSE